MCVSAYLHAHVNARMPAPETSFGNRLVTKPACAHVCPWDKFQVSSEYLLLRLTYSCPIVDSECIVRMAWPKKYCGLVLLLTYIITFADYIASSYLPPRITSALTLRKENMMASLIIVSSVNQNESNPPMHTC
jgi:hypothetical protein